MATYSSREEAIDRDLIPALRVIGIDPDDVDLEAIARKTLSSSQGFSQPRPVWWNKLEGERLRVIAEQHRRA